MNEQDKHIKLLEDILDVIKESSGSNVAKHENIFKFHRNTWKIYPILAVTFFVVPEKYGLFVCAAGIIITLFRVIFIIWEVLDLLRKDHYNRRKILIYIEYLTKIKRQE